MKLTPAILLLAAAAPSLAQTTPAKPTVRHTTTPAHTAAKSSACETGPVLPASVPKVSGCAKPLYALTYVDTVVGTGDLLTPRKWLTVNYTGYLTDGTKFDSSLGTAADGKPREPITFPYGAHQVITGWDTGFEGMHIGGKRRLFIPYQLAYGEAGRPPVIPAKAELVFDVELLSVSDTPPAPKTPPTPSKPATPPAAPAKPASDAPTSPGTQSTPDSTVGKPTTSPVPDTTKPAPTDPTKPTSVPPKQ